MRATPLTYGTDDPEANIDIIAIIFMDNRHHPGEHSAVTYRPPIRHLENIWNGQSCSRYTCHYSPTWALGPRSTPKVTSISCMRAETTTSPTAATNHTSASCTRVSGNQRTGTSSSPA